MKMTESYENANKKIEMLNVLEPNITTRSSSRDDDLVVILGSNTMSSKNRRRNGLHGTENLQMIQIKKHPLITRIVIIMSMEEGLEGGRDSSSFRNQTSNHCSSMSGDMCSI